MKSLCLLLLIAQLGGCSWVWPQGPERTASGEACHPVGYSWRGYTATAEGKLC